MIYQESGKNYKICIGNLIYQESKKYKKKLYWEYDLPGVMKK